MARRNHILRPKPRSTVAHLAPCRLSGSPAVGVYRGMSQSRQPPTGGFRETRHLRHHRRVSPRRRFRLRRRLATSPARQAGDVQSGTRCCRLEPDRPERHRRAAGGFQARRPSSWASSTRPSTTWSVAIEGGYRPYAITPTVPPNTSLEAAVATAVHRVLVGRFDDPPIVLDLENVYNAYLNGIPDGEAKTNGIAVGEEVGLGMLALRANDGLNDMVPYVQPPPGPGVYEPTAPAPPVGTRLPRVMPLALESASQFRPNGPPALSSGEYAKDFNEVKDAGACRQQRAERGPDRPGAVLDRQ